MSLRFRLLILSSIVLLLPWAGCQYARQMEGVLRGGQERALLTTAQLLAKVVSSDRELIEQSFDLAANGERPRLFAVQLQGYPSLDGYADEWPQPMRAIPATAAPTLNLGIYGGALYALLHVVDAHVTYEVPGNEDRPVRATGDRVLIATRDLTGVETAWTVSALAPGPVVVRRANFEAPWKAASNEDFEIRGVWRATADGFDVELRIPQRFVGAELAIEHIDDAAPPSTIELAQLHVASEPLRDKLAIYAPEGVRIFVVDAQGWLVARAGSLRSSLNDYDADPQNWYRWVLGRSEAVAPAYGLPYGMWGQPVDEARSGTSSAIWFQANAGDPSTVRAAVPIYNDRTVIGVIAVEQAGGQLIRDRDAAFGALLRFTLLGTVFAVVAAFVFAAWLSRRIRRLSVAAAGALSPRGDVETRLPEMDARDELGALARSYATLLQRVKEYTQYLQTLGSKLSHEFRTPLAIISSSLENLAAEKTNHSQDYIQRARDGATRLHGILSAMSEATRIEQSIESAERVDFDLGDLIRGVAQAYAQTFATHRIDVKIPSESCPFNGAPELIVQMLDKLVDNAVDFCPPGGRILIELQAAPQHFTLGIENDGPLLAPDAEHRLFDMLVSNRTQDSGKPHLGLGLFIVQAIARFHGGQASGHNLENLAGVRFEIRLPRR